MLSFSYKEIHRSCKVLISSILFRKMPIRSNQLHFAVHYDQPISVYFLDRRRGRESWTRRQGRSQREGCRMTSKTTISAHPKALDKFAYPRYSRHWRLSSYASNCRDPIGISSIDANKATLPWGIIVQRRTQTKSTAQSLENLAVRNNDNAITRQIARRFGQYKACNSTNVNQAYKRIGVTVAQQHGSCKRRLWILVEAAPHLAGVGFIAAARPIRETWGKAGI